MKKVVVTGGAGFIGLHLVSALESLGYEVAVVDIALNQKSDVRDLEYMKKICRGAVSLFHLAALPSVQYSIEHPVETNETNLIGTLNTLIAAKDAGVKRVIFSSTAAVYGNPENFPVNENTKTYPMSPYAVQKLASEEYLKLFSCIYNLETVSFRYFNVYGPGQSSKGAYASVIPKFIEQKKLGVPLTIVGDGEQTRDFVHVSDVVRANILAMESNKVGKGEIINIGSSKESSVNIIANLIGGQKENIPARLEPRRSVTEISCAKELLGWEPKIKLEEGVKGLLT
jgi:UDP-glucose 4-epimerase